MADQRQASQRLMIRLIMGGLAAWAIYLAIGAYLYNFNVLRALVVLGCMAAFLGFWALMLWSQGAPPKRN
jgi:hypothetical protein